MNFAEWLENEKGLSHKVSHDVDSRLKRVQLLLATDEINKNTVSLLEKNEKFKSLSMTVKSQLRRSVRLNLEHQAK